MSGDKLSECLGIFVPEYQVTGLTSTLLLANKRAGRLLRDGSL